MREHPLIMKGPLVRATLAGLKTQTRRPVKNEALPYTGYWAGCLCKEIDPSDTPCVTCAMRFPGIPEAGDRLWVRETWCLASAESETTPPDLRPMRGSRWCYYYATEPDVEHEEGDNRSPWRPSIHMPRWACRLVLPLVSVRVERLRDITEAGAKAEGVEPIGGSYREGFRAVWESIYGSWDLNPWIWVAEWDHIEVASAEAHK